MNNDVEAGRSHGLGAALAALIGHTAVATLALALLWDSRGSVQALLFDTRAVLSTTMTHDSTLASAAIGFAGLLVALFAVWSIASLVIAETIVASSHNRRLTPTVHDLTIRLSSPLVRPIVRKRLATATLSITLLSSATPAFATEVDHIPSDLGWTSVSQSTQIYEGAAESPQPASNHSSDLADAEIPSTSEAQALQTEESAPTEPPPAPPEQGETEAPTETEASPAPSDSDTSPQEFTRLGVPAASSSKETETTETDGFDAELKLVLAEALAITKQAVPIESPPGTYTVREGDSLWSIAARQVQTTDPIAISDAWNRIYQLNRELIGDSPDLIYPGMTLNLPKESN